MPNHPGEAAGGANNAAISSDQPTKPGCVVELDDGWTVSADSPAELIDLIDQKLAQAHQARDDANTAIKRWEKARKQVGQ